MAVERKRQGRENGVGDDREPMDTSNQTSMFAEKYNREQLPDLLRIYYQRIFPFQKYFEWLFYGRRNNTNTHTLIILVGLAPCTVSFLHRQGQF